MVSYMNYQEVGKEGLLSADMKQSISAVDDVKRLLRIRGLGNVGDLQTDLLYILIN